jgi:hypothetical protein
MKKEKDKIYREMDILWRNLNLCRGYFPCVEDSSVGRKILLTPPHYQAQGINIIHSFEEPLTIEKKDEMLRIGHWINQNFVIRLCALMESYHMLSKTIEINFMLDGAEQLNIVRRLRNRFAHSSGRYNPDTADGKDLATMKLMRNHLGISIEGRTDWPLAINTVLPKLLEGCRLYVKEKLKDA